MMRPQPLIVVQNVALSRTWYESILGLHSGHGGDEYERMMYSDEIILQLHQWDAHEHQHLGDFSKASGNGVILWFQSDQFDTIVVATKKHQAIVLEGPKFNDRANHREIWLQDPDGYKVVGASIPE